MKLTLDRIGGPLTASEAEQASNRARVAELDAALAEKRATARAGWGAKYAHRKGKMTTWERIDALIDPGARSADRLDLDKEAGGKIRHDRGVATEAESRFRFGVFDHIGVAVDAVIPEKDRRVDVT